MYLSTPALWPALLAFLALAIPLLVTDLRESRLPLGLNAALLASGLLLLPPATLAVEDSHLRSGVTTSAVLVALMLVLFVLARGGLGFGDVILVAGLGLYAGFVSLLAALAGLWVGCVITLVHSRIRRRRSGPGPVPFGPGLILGTALAMLIPGIGG